MGRPKGIRDSKARKRKTILSLADEMKLLKDIEGGLNSKDIKAKYKISKTALCAIRSRRNIKPQIDPSVIAKWETIADLESNTKTSGIYCIYFIDQNNYNNIKAYIGSSVNILKRLKTHQRDLINSIHCNECLQAIYNDSNYTIRYAIIEKCNEQEIMQKETFYLHQWHNGCLLNTWKATRVEDIKPWLSKALSMEAYNKNYVLNYNIIYDGTPCKESNCIHKDGYGRMNVQVDGVRKSIKKHRIAYWEKHGEYPELVRHLCNNSKCYNADHLASGNYRDNALDKRGDFPRLFENAWIEHRGDIEQISKIFNWKYPIDNSPVYYWEKEFSLRDKYSDIVLERSGRVVYDKAIKDYIVGLLDNYNKNQIQELCLKKFNVLVGDRSIYRLGSPQPILKDQSYTENPIYQFIKDNLDKYVDVELCHLINTKFDAELTADRLTTMRFRWGLYRGNLKPEQTLKRLGEDSIYGIEFREFLRVNYLQYTDEQLAELCIMHKITNGQMPLDMSFVDFIKKQRLVFYGFLRDGEKNSRGSLDPMVRSVIGIVLIDKFR